MNPTICHAGFLLLLSVLAPGCVPTPQRQAAAFTPTDSVIAERSRESRRFDSNDRPLIMQASIGVLQDLGFTVEESQTQFGMIVASKLAGARIRAQIVVRSVPDAQAITVRANFQRVGFAPGASIAHGETLTDPEIYRGFFEKLAHSVFLTAHEI